MELKNLEISTNRLLLKPMEMKYKNEIFREFTEEITNFLYVDPPLVISETELFINKSMLAMQQAEKLTVVILKKDSEEFLGCSDIRNINTQYPEMGIWLKKSAHGNSYGLETITALKEWAENNLNYEYLIYPVDRTNLASRRIPEQLGGKIYQEFKKVKLNGKVLDIVEYRFTKVG